MCELIGQVRAAGLTGDLWCLGLGGYHSGIAAVQAARDVPTDAQNYVDVVAGYVAWYALQPEFGGPGIPEPTPRFSGPPTSPATETIMPDGTIHSVGMCMGVAGASTVDMAPVHVAYRNGHPAQLFRLTPRTTW
jgi:hypothetical protein